LSYQIELHSLLQLLELHFPTEFAVLSLMRENDNDRGNVHTTHTIVSVPYDYR